MDSFILKQLTRQIAYSLSTYSNVPFSLFQIAYSLSIYSNVPFSLFVINI
jgi:hypothetical protein